MRHINMLIDEMTTNRLRRFKKKYALQIRKKYGVVTYAAAIRFLADRLNDCEDAAS